MSEHVYLSAKSLLAIAERGAGGITDAQVQRLVAECFRLRAELDQLQARTQQSEATRGASGCTTINEVACGRGR